MFSNSCNNLQELTVTGYRKLRPIQLAKQSYRQSFTLSYDFVAKLRAWVTLLDMVCPVLRQA